VAAELAEQLGMTVTRDLTQYHHIVATLMGEETGVDAFALVVETLESTLQTGFRGTAAYLVKIAARYLVNAGHAETAALCMLQPDIGFPDILPDYGISSIPEGAWESARGQAPTLDILDVAERALKELRALGAPTLPSSS
jgi:hypothetical protein